MLLLKWWPTSMCIISIKINLLPWFLSYSTWWFWYFIFSRKDKISIVIHVISSINWLKFIWSLSTAFLIFFQYIWLFAIFSFLEFKFLSLFVNLNKLLNLALFNRIIIEIIHWIILVYYLEYLRNGKRHYRSYTWFSGSTNIKRV
jgi:hypothetical protein